jgi:hypothetical protein
LDAGNAISEAKETDASLRDVAKAGGEVALAEKSIAAQEYAQQQRAFRRQNQSIASAPDTGRVVREAAIGQTPQAEKPAPDTGRVVREAAIGQTPQAEKPAPDTGRVVREAAIGQTPQAEKPAPDITDGVHALEDVLSKIESAKQRSMARGDLSSARKYEQLYDSTNRQYRGEMGGYEKESANFERIKAKSDSAEQERKFADTAESKAYDEKALKDKEYDDALDVLKSARKESVRADKLAAEEADKDPDSEDAKNAAKVAKSAEKNATQAEQAAEKASHAAAAAEEKYTAAKQKAAKATQDAEAKQAALEKAAKQRHTDAAERALKLGNIAADARAGQKAIGAKTQEEGDEAHKSLLARTMLGISKAINRGSGYIGQAGSGNIAGAAIGAAGDATSVLSLVKGMGAAGAVGAAFVGLAAAGNKLSEQWEKVMQPSMALTASLGELSNDAHRNSLAFRNVFMEATHADVLHGYTLEEGLSLANQMAKLGVGGVDDVVSAEERVFRWQRETDADRGTLAQAVGMASRYRGGEDVLGYVAGGLKESGMYSGQYQEYLNATLRIFEEGLSRGVVKGFSEITRTQNMLAQIGTTWQGEQGAEKYQRMEDAVTRASDLQSDYDVILYKAAQSLMEQGKESGDSGNYIDVAKVLDKGLTPALLNTALGTMSQNAGGDAQSTILQIMKGFGLSATSAEEVYKLWQKGDITQAKSRIEGTNSGGAESHEMDLLDSMNSIKTDVSTFGADFTVHKANVFSGIKEIVGLIGGKTEKEIAVRDSAGKASAAIGGYDQRVTETMLDALQKDRLGGGGYADNVAAVNKALNDVSPAIQNKIDLDPKLNAYLYEGLSNPEDYTDEAVDRFREKLSEIKLPASITPQTAGRMGFGQEWNDAATRTDNAASQQYAASVWERYGSLAQYKKSEEYNDMREALNKRKEGGLTELEIKDSADFATGRYKERFEREIGKVEYYGRNLNTVADSRDEGFGALQNMLKKVAEMPGVHEPVIAKVNESIQATTSTSSPGGVVITADEIKSLIEAIRDLIPVLKENAEFTVEAQ